MSLISGETHNATVWNGAVNLISEIISVTDSFKPRVPTIVKLVESHGEVEVTWRTNMDHAPSVSDDLRAIVTYHEMGETPQVSEPFKPITENGLRYYEISDLDESTTYLVSVKSVYWNGLPSDSSEEVEITTRSWFAEL